MKTNISILAFAIILSLSNGLFAQNSYRTFKQPDGTTFSAIERGEEFLQFFETPEGYVVRSGTDGFYYYFDINAQGEFIKTNVKAGTKNPLNVRSKPYNEPLARAALIKQIDEYNKSAERNRERYLSLQRKWLQGHKAEKGIPSLEKTTMDETTLNVGILLVEFNNVPHYTSQAHPNGYSVSEFETMLLSDDSYNTESPDDEDVFGSVRDYFEYQSHGILHITGNVINASSNGIPKWINLGDTTSYLGFNKNIISHAINAAIDSGWNCDYDIISVIISRDFHSGIHLYTGFAAFQSGPYGFSSNDFDPSFDYENWFGGYVVKEREDLEWGAGHVDTTHSAFTHIGIHCHEMFHVLGWGIPNILGEGSEMWHDFPYGEDTDFSLMGTGYRTGPLRKCECPMDLDPAARIAMEWAVPTEVNTSLKNETISYIEEDDNINANFDYYQFYHSATNKYYIVENRQYSGFNQYGPGWWKTGTKGGLLIWITSGQERHLIRADNDSTCYVEGMPHVSGGDLGDPFPGEYTNRLFAFNTTPNSNISGYFTGFTVANISSSGTNMTADFYPNGWRGTISSNTTWSSGISPYYVIDNLTIASVATLTIQSGVTAKINSDKSIYVSGQISATGATFTHNGAATPGGWYAIDLEENATEASSFDGCTFKFAVNPIYVNNTEYHQITDCVFDSCRYGVTGNYSGFFNIFDCTMKNCTYDGIWLGSNSSTAQIHGTVIQSNSRHGIYCYLSSPVMSECRVKYNGSYGLFMDNTSDPCLIPSSVSYQNMIYDNGDDEVYGYYYCDPILGSGGYGLPTTQQVIKDDSGYLVDLDSYCDADAYRIWWGSSPPDTNQFSVDGTSALGYTPYATSDPGWQGKTATQAVVVDNNPYHRARIKIQEGNNKEAIALLKEQIESFPESGDAHHALVKLFSINIRGAYDESEGNLLDYFKYVIGKYPTLKLHAMELSAILLTYQRYYKNVIEIYDILLSDPQNSNPNVVQNALSFYTYKIGDLNKSQELLAMLNNMPLPKSILDEVNTRFELTKGHIKPYEGELKSTSKFSIENSSLNEDSKNTLTPNEFNLHPVYPNPFNPATIIKFDLPEASSVVITIYNVLGQKIATLINGKLPAGRHEREWNAARFSSGIYFVRMQAGDFVKTTKITLLK